MDKLKRFEVITVELAGYGRGTNEANDRLTSFGEDGWMLIAVDNGVAYFQREVLE